MSIRPLEGFVAPASLERPDLHGAGKSFEGRLRELLADVDRMLDRSTQPPLLVGEATVAHAVTTAGEEANLALTLIVEIRNRLVEAYQELARMQV